MIEIDDDGDGESQSIDDDQSEDNNTKQQSNTRISRSYVVPVPDGAGAPQIVEQNVRKMFHHVMYVEQKHTVIILIKVVKRKGINRK